jgi:hypothetical protein
LIFAILKKYIIKWQKFKPKEFWLNPRQWHRINVSLLVWNFVM